MEVFALPSKLIRLFSGLFSGELEFSSRGMVLPAFPAGFGFGIGSCQKRSIHLGCKVVPMVAVQAAGYWCQCTTRFLLWASSLDFAFCLECCLAGSQLPAPLVFLFKMIGMVLVVDGWTPSFDLLICAFVSMIWIAVVFIDDFAYVSAAADWVSLLLHVCSCLEAFIFLAGWLMVCSLGSCYY